MIVGSLLVEGVLILIGIFFLIFPLTGWILTLVVNHFKEEEETRDQTAL